MKISFMARSQKKTVKELFLSAILSSYCMLFIQNRIPMTVSDLFKQQDEVFHKILMLPTPKCLAYVTHIHSDLELHNLQDYYYLDQISDREMLFNYKGFQKGKAKFREVEIENVI